MIKIQWLASIGCQNDQNKAKLQKWSKSNDLHRLDVKTIKTKLNYKSDQNPILASIWRQNDQNVELRRKTFKTKLNYKSDKNPMTCIDLTSKRSKCWVTSQNIQNKAKLQKWSKSNDLHRFDVKTIKTFKTNLNYKSDQNPMTCIDWMSKRSKQRYTTKVIKIQWLASIWRQNDQNVELRRKTFKTKLNYKSDQNPMTCIDLTSKRSKCWVTSQNIQNKAKLQKWSKLNDLHRFDVKTIKTFKTKLNYKSDQNPMTCIDLTSKRSKCWGTSQNIQNNAKLQNWSNYNELNRFDVKKIKMLSYVAKHSKQT